MSITMSFKKAELLEKLVANRDKHDKDFKHARKGWLEDVAIEGEKIVASAKEGELKILPERATRHTRHDHPMTEILFEEPQNHTKEYDRVISMLEMASDETIKLTDGQFREFVQDEWGWKEDWLHSNTKYMK